VHGFLTGPDTLARHDEAHARHPGTDPQQLARVRARYHGSFAYITAVLRNGE
jgi:hypothetical protein